ncbi:PGF-CTERM sorting domain-containing protein [Halorussus gelatinilyticus]|uniref:PGF-CTERM sorting domain-containing protein n=1 Tax=Halorussus gelatinilyticus TaxID=2937524 RepID=A0A8U0INH2_9EURY|nr:PGF-CTERM sorting domain-containing protein [Halorussus gelatinilyticus]UPW02002.1 PGF-CTERM sorting domain-containing protein [Halorussus gelatinilyticus]
MKRLASALVLLVVTTSVVPAATAGGVPTATQQTSGEAYSGTHVSFEVSNSAVTDYAVDNETVLDSVRVQSQSNVEDGGLVDLGASLSAVTRIEGAGLSVGAKTTTEASLQAETGANLTVHDNGHGVLVVESGTTSDYVVANLSSGADASAESDSQVEVTTESGTNGTFLVVGEGNVTVNDEGDVTASLGEDGRLVFRSYPDGKDDGDEKQEQLIANGEAKAEAYVMSDGGETVVDTVSYGANTTVETTETAEGEVSFTVNRTTHEGTVLLTSVSETVLNASDDLEVTVDGEAAAEARTYTQLKSAIGSDRSRYVVESTGGASADASADVLVAVNHFSERTISMQSADSTSETTSDGETTTDDSQTTTDDSQTTTDDSQTTTDDSQMTTDGSQTTSADGESAGAETNTTTVVDDETDNGAGVPGFTGAAAIVALAGAAMLARRR